MFDDEHDLRRPWIRRLTIRGYKSIRELEDFELRPLNVLIGANGAGKSNFIGFLRLLTAMMRRKLQETVIRQGGPDWQLFLGRKQTPQLSAHLGFGYADYGFELAATTDNRLVFLKEEGAGLSMGGGDESGFAQLSDDRQGGDEGDAQARIRASTVKDAMKRWVVYHFQDTSDSARVKRLWPVSDGAVLLPDAANLAAFLYHLRLKHGEHFERMTKLVRLVAPFFDEFLLEPNVSNKALIELRWRQRGSDYPFHGSQLSDGTLRFICLVAALAQPDPPATIVIDEPELGLHPYALEVLGGLLSSASHHVQLVVSTQSAALLEHVEPEDVVVVERATDGASTFRRLDHEALASWLADYSLAELWHKNVLGGRP